MTTSTVKALVQTSALIALLAGFRTAPADTVTQHRTLRPAPVTVNYADLNLAAAEGARVLYGRISMAASEVCGSSFAVWYPTVSRTWRECYKATVENAIKQVNQPTLTAFYEQSIKVATR